MMTGEVDGRSHAIEPLRGFLKGLAAGPVGECAEVERLLAKCWDDFKGDDGAMQSDKLHGRTENLFWNPPCLSFEIERHGGTVLGSTRAELQKWTLDLDKLTRRVDSRGHRQLKPKKAPLYVKPLAYDVARLINDKSEDSRVTWKDGRVRVNIDQIIPKNAPKQTVAGRRRRFWKTLDGLLAPNWTRNRTTYEPVEQDEKRSSKVR